MRDTKFRGKCQHCDAWAYGNLVDYGKDEAPEIHGFDPFRDGEEEWREITVDRWTVGQFTGLTDNNGHEIYEGDILTWRSIICEEDPVETWELPVTFYNGCFCLNDDSDMTLISVIYDSEEFGGVKIIGNIHDNPELMERGYRQYFR